MKKYTAAAVLTGDMVNSSALSPAERKTMLKQLQLAMDAGKKRIPDWNAEIFQGDSFQGVTAEGLRESLRYALMIFTHLRKHQFTIRIAIGIGDIRFHSGLPGTSDGAAFLHSGRTLDALKKKSGTLIGIRTTDEETNLEYEVHCTSLDHLLIRCTPLQAEALFHALEGFTQLQIAKKLKIAQPTVQQRLQAAGWPVFKAILHRFESKY